MTKHSPAISNVFTNDLDPRPIYIIDRCRHEGGVRFVRLLGRAGRTDRRCQGGRPPPVLRTQPNERAHLQEWGNQKIR